MSLMPDASSSMFEGWYSYLSSSFSLINSTSLIGSSAIIASSGYDYPRLEIFL